MNKMKTKLKVDVILTMALATMISTTSFANSDHVKMDHSNNKDHSSMDHSKMDHSMMDMAGMSEVGMPALGAKPDKVIHVLLHDDMSIKFKKEVKIEPNDVVQFVVMNVGKMEHEFAIGSANEQLAHREMMKSMPHHKHDSGNAVTVPAGKAKQLIWHFHGDNKIEFACNIAGHAEAGMIKKVVL